MWSINDRFTLSTICVNAMQWTVFAFCIEIKLPCDNILSIEHWIPLSNFISICHHRYTNKRSRMVSLSLCLPLPVSFSSELKFNGIIGIAWYLIYLNGKHLRVHAMTTIDGRSIFECRMSIVSDNVQCIRCSMSLNLNVVSVRHVSNLIIIESGQNGVLVIMNNEYVHKIRNMKILKSMIFHHTPNPLTQHCSLFHLVRQINYYIYCILFDANYWPQRFSILNFTKNTTSFSIWFRCIVARAVRSYLWILKF